ncbi:MAG: peptide-methionine (S)-S-oxide reductase MsrA [Gemmatimonadetes bacterium]|nr:peptide-methionine (S)-S-oxide reductase MsrA [Chloroflexota bacterium]MBA3583512.1 peptide-methionine (S)-S-oxide reductase MsrA [Gemmatimonadota bacterium]
MKVSPEQFPDPEIDASLGRPDGAEQVAVLAGGCFWCVEAVYAQLDGVLAVENGYAGGTADTADYETVCSGRTGHAEVVRVRFDPAKLTLGQILKVFFSIAHDPTQKDGQGNDIGRQYRSAIFYTDEEQKAVAAAYIAQLDAARVFDRPIVTEITPLVAFYEAEPYHADYARRNPNSGYIRAVAAPKVAKVRRYYGDRLKV